MLGGVPEGLPERQTVGRPIAREPLTQRLSRPLAALLKSDLEPRDAHLPPKPAVGFVLAVAVQELAVGLQPVQALLEEGRVDAHHGRQASLALGARPIIALPCVGSRPSRSTSRRKTMLSRISS